MEITANRVRCKSCGDVIESRATNELVMCRCGACGVDGGHEYLRRLGEESACDELSTFRQPEKSP
jgi:DNA-directed RNA polymerase subunit N (RpoN/RPB10)